MRRRLATQIGACLLILCVLSADAAWGQEKKKDGKKPDAAQKEEEPANTVDLVMARSRELMKKLHARQRNMDPFGLSMDPEDLAQPMHAPIMEEEPEPQVITTMQEAVSKFHITGVIPGQGKIIVGARALGVGDKILIKHLDVTFRLRISNVTLDYVELEDMETGEKAQIKHGIVPRKPPGLEAAPNANGVPSGIGISPMNGVMTVE